MEFGRVQKILGEDGKVKARTVYVTKDIEIKQGDTIYLNELEDSLTTKVRYNLISEDEKAERLAKIREMDGKFNRETTHVLRLAKKKEAQ